MTTTTTPIDDFSHLRILVIDGQAQVLVWVYTVLKRMGIPEVTEVRDGRTRLRR